MAHTERVRRGQPILYLGLLLFGWVSLRLALWESPWPMLPRPVEVFRLSELDRGETAPVRPICPDGETPDPAAGTQLATFLPLASHTRLPTQEGAGQEQLFAENRRVIGQNLLWMAGMASLPMPRSVDTWLDAASPAADLAFRPASSGANIGLDRWRVDGWLVLREGSRRLSTAGDRPSSYGASQAGAVLAYRLAPHDRHDPAAYLRVSRALVSGGETEGAAGLRIRPVPVLPVNLHAEVRVTEYPDRTEIRRAAFASAGLPETRLPFDLRAEGYAQAGYVTGDFATGFVDGRVTVGHKVQQTDSTSLEAGLGVWGGAQRDAARLDVGPRLQATLRVGGAPARLSADYRFRVAGAAEPKNGVAITLSTGF